MNTTSSFGPIKVVIGLGNPGKKFERTRHNSGFLILDALADAYHGSWKAERGMELATVVIQDQPVLLIKPQTFMNSSGDVVPFLQKKGIEPAEILVVHDELELPFGVIKLKMGGSAKGHNGLRSIIGRMGDQFPRLRFGIDRPADREQVPDYVLAPFKQTNDELRAAIDEAIRMIVGVCK